MLTLRKAGYSTLAEVLASDPRWMMFRGFRPLQVRLILEKQDELRLLETELREMEEEDRAKYKLDEKRPRRLCTRQRADEEEEKARKELFEKIEKVFHEYGELRWGTENSMSRADFRAADLMIKVRQLTAFEAPEQYEYKAVRQYVVDTKPLVIRELDWIKVDNDIVSLRGPKEHGQLGAALEKGLNWLIQSKSIQVSATFISGLRSCVDLPKKMWSALRPWHSRDIPTQQKGKPIEPESEEQGLEQGEKMKSEKTNGFDGPIQAWLAQNMQVEEATSRIICSLLLLLVPVMFVVPIYALHQMGEQTGDHVRESIGVLIAFAVAFAFVLVIGTPAKPHEVLGVSAA